MSCGIFCVSRCRDCKFTMAMSPERSRSHNGLKAPLDFVELVTGGDETFTRIASPSEEHYTDYREPSHSSKLLEVQ